MNRAEGHHFRPGQLHHLQVVSVVEVECLVPGNANFKPLAQGVFLIELELDLWQGFSSSRDIQDAVYVEAVLHNLADPVNPLSKSFVPGLALQDRHQPQVAHGQVHLLISADYPHNLDTCIALYLCDGLLGVSIASYLVEDHSQKLHLWIKVHVAFDQSCATSRDAPRIYNEDHRSLQELGNLRGASYVAFVALVKPSHALNHCYVCILCSMAVDLPDGSLAHEAAVQVTAVSASDPGVIARIDVVHSYLEWLHRKTSASQRREQPGHNRGLAA